MSIKQLKQLKQLKKWFNVYGLFNKETKLNIDGSFTQEHLDAMDYSSYSDYVSFALMCDEKCYKKDDIKWLYHYKELLK